MKITLPPDHTKEPPFAKGDDWHNPIQISDFDDLKTRLEMAHRHNQIIEKQTNGIYKARYLYRGQSLFYDRKASDLIPSIFRKDTWYPNEFVFLSQFFDQIAGVNLEWTKSLSFLQKIAVAQHYGLPTRLMDFTRNPIIGLFFAVSSFQETDKAAQVEDKIVDALRGGATDVVVDAGDTLDEYVASIYCVSMSDLKMTEAVDTLTRATTDIFGFSTGAPFEFKLMEIYVDECPRIEKQEGTFIMSTFPRSDLKSVLRDPKRGGAPWSFIEFQFTRRVQLEAIKWLASQGITKEFVYGLKDDEEKKLVEICKGILKEFNESVNPSLPVGMKLT